MKKEKIVLGISGGVDSSVAAILLQSQGYEVHGVFMKNWDDKNAICNAEDDYADALSICNKLKIAPENCSPKLLPKIARENCSRKLLPKIAPENCY